MYRIRSKHNLIDSNILRVCRYFSMISKTFSALIEQVVSELRNISV